MIADCAALTADGRRGDAGAEDLSGHVAHQPERQLHAGERRVAGLDRRRRRGGELRTSAPTRSSTGTARRSPPPNQLDTAAANLSPDCDGLDGILAALGHEPAGLEAGGEGGGHERHGYSVVTFAERWFVAIGCTGGPDGPTPVGWVCVLKNCMNVSPSTTFSAADAPSLIVSAVITTSPSCSKRIELLPLPLASRIDLAVVVEGQLVAALGLQDAERRRGVLAAVAGRRLGAGLGAEVVGAAGAVGRAPERPDPDRPADVAGRELDPHGVADLREEQHPALLAAAGRHAGQRPAAVDLLAEHRRHLRADAADLLRVGDVGDDAFVLAVEPVDRPAAGALAVGLAHCAGTSSADWPKLSWPVWPVALRVATKLCSSVAPSSVVRTDCT